MLRLDPRFNAALVAARTFVREAEVVYQKRPKPLSQRLRTEGAVVEFVCQHRPNFRVEEQELFLVLALNAKHCVTRVIEVAKGSAASVDVHPREVFRPLIACAALAAIVLHNHPSGDPEPSADDLALTVRLRDVGQMVGIPVLDHIIIGSDGHVSLSTRGLL